MRSGISRALARAALAAALVASWLGTGAGVAHPGPLQAPVARPIAAYSQAQPPAYEFVWPTGEPLPLYRASDLARPPLPGGLVASPRLIPASEWESQIETSAVAVARLVRRALIGLDRGDPRVRAALLLPPAPASTAGSVGSSAGAGAATGTRVAEGTGVVKGTGAAAGTAETFGLRVQFAQSTGESERRWLVTGVAPLDEAYASMCWRTLGRVPVPPDALPVGRFDSPTWTIDAGLARSMSPRLGLLRDAVAPDLPCALPRLAPLADASGRLDRDLFVSIFREEEKGLYDRPLWPSVQIFPRLSGTAGGARDVDSMRGADRQGGPGSYGDARGATTIDTAGATGGRWLPVFDGRTDSDERRVRIAHAILKEPAKFLACVAPVPPVAGTEKLLYSQVVVLRGDSATVPPGGRSESESLDPVETTAWTSVVVRAYPEPAVTPPPSTGALDRACDAAALLSARRYAEWLRRIDGEDEWPAGDAGPAMRFTQRSTRLSAGQLGEVARRLAAQHRLWGLNVTLQPCVFQGRRYENVIADIPGSMPGTIVLADHYDTAVAEDTTDGGASGHEERWKAAPGADDDGTGTAALLETARVLAVLTARGRHPLRHTVRIIHFVGEEFPADCLGARTYVASALERHENLLGVIVLDMIGHDPLGEGIFQISMGESRRSGELAGAVLALRSRLAERGLLDTSLAARVRTRFDPQSYLYNTDGVIFSDVGYPVILLNEHLNRFHGLGRTGYHDMLDTTANVRPEYAAALARLALGTVTILAQ